MEATQNKTVTINTNIHAPIDKVWQYFSAPEHIVKWNNASADWHTPRAENDLRTGGKFISRMEAKDGSFGFDFFGTYDEVKDKELIAYTLGDNRKVSIHFTPNGNETSIEETFETESTHSIEMQRTGWQSILDNFKKYVETH